MRLLCFGALFIGERANHALENRGAPVEVSGGTRAQTRFKLILQVDGLSNSANPTDFLTPLTRAPALYSTNHLTAPFLIQSPRNVSAQKQ